MSCLFNCGHGRASRIQLQSKRSRSDMYGIVRTSRHCYRTGGYQSVAVVSCFSEVYRRLLSAWRTTEVYRHRLFQWLLCPMCFHRLYTLGLLDPIEELKVGKQYDGDRIILLFPLCTVVVLLSRIICWPLWLHVPRKNSNVVRYWPAHNNFRSAKPCIDACC